MMKIGSNKYYFLFSKTFEYFLSYIFSSESEGQSSCDGKHGYKSYKNSICNFSSNSYFAEYHHKGKE